MYLQLQPPEELVQPQRLNNQGRTIDYWDPSMEPHILKAVSIIVFENLQKVFKTILIYVDESKVLLLSP